MLVWKKFLKIPTKRGDGKLTHRLTYKSLVITIIQSLAISLGTPVSNAIQYSSSFVNFTLGLIYVSVETVRKLIIPLDVYY